MELDSPVSQDNKMVTRIFSFVLIAGMMTSGAFTLLSLVDRLLPGWRPLYLAALIFFTAFERLYTFKRFGRLLVFSRAWAVALLAEWVVILLVVKLAVGLSHGLDNLWLEMQYWQVDFASSFFSLDFIIALLLVLTGWFLAGGFAGLMEDIGIEQVQAYQSADIPRPVELPPRERLFNLVVNLGTFLIIITALVRVDLRAAFGNSGGDIFISMPAFAGGGLSTLLYFMLALVLLSQAQFIDLLTRWRLLEIPVGAEIARRWAIYGLVFFAILAAAVSFLPTGYSLGLLSTLGYGLRVIGGVLFYLGELLYTLFMLILMLLLSIPYLLLRMNNRISIQPPQAPVFPPELMPSQDGGAGSWLTLLKSLAFWLTIILLLGFSIRQYMQQHREALQSVSKFAGVAWLGRLWDWLAGLFTGLRSRVRLALHRPGLQEAKSQGSGGLLTSLFRGLGGLSPRQRIMFFYLAFLRRGSEHSLGRRASQTPGEYAAAMDKALPDVEAQIDSLTGAFIEARYSDHPLEPRQADLARETWARIRKVLRGKIARP